MNLPKGDCIYIIQSKDFIKVGYTTDIMQRLQSHKRTLKDPDAEVILIVYNAYAHRIEQSVHTVFKPLYKKEYHRIENKEEIVKFILRHQEGRTEELKIFF